MIIAVSILVGSVVVLSIVGHVIEKRRCRLCSGKHFLAANLPCPLCNDDALRSQEEISTNRLTS